MTGVDVVVTENLTKLYGPQVALQALNLRVPAGTLFGFLGPNGAGKTTALRLLLGLLRPTAGRAEVLGRDCWRDGPRLRADVGYLPGDVRFYDWMTGRQTLAFLDAARGSVAGSELTRLVKRFELNPDRKVRDYSRGMKQKLGLIAALMHRPRLLILDEPTVALDPLMREVLYAELRAVAAEGRAVLFSSHTLAEVEELCDQVAILRDGRLIEQASISELRRRAVRQVEVHFRDGQPRPGLPPGLQVLEQSQGYLRGTWSGPPGELLAWLASCPVREVTLAPPDLSDLFLGYYAEAGPHGR